jgi:hypothetical protein
LRQDTKLQSLAIASNQNLAVAKRGRAAVCDPTPQTPAICRGLEIGITVIQWFNGPAVSGADPIEARPGCSALLDRIEGNGVRIVLVEDDSRFAALPLPAASRVEYRRLIG